MSDPKQSDRVRAFLADILALEQRHGLTLGHEDGHGAFEVSEGGDGENAWLNGAADCTPEGRRLYRSWRDEIAAASLARRGSK